MSMLRTSSKLGNGIFADSQAQNHVASQVDHYAYCAAVHRQLAGNVIRGPDMVHEQESLVGRVFAGRTLDHAVCINPEVRICN